MNDSAPQTERRNGAVVRYLRSNPKNIHRIVATDSTGRRACYVLSVPATRQRAFIDAMNANDGANTVDLDEFGILVDACYGEQPSDEMRQRLRETYGLDF